MKLGPVLSPNIAKKTAVSLILVTSCIAIIVVAVTYFQKDPKILSMLNHPTSSPESMSLTPAESIPTPTPSSLPTPLPVDLKVATSSVSIRNGTRVSGLAAKVSSQVKKEYSKLKIRTSNASVTNYQTSQISVVNDKASDLSKELAKLLNMEIKPLPATEKTTSDIDLVIILGSDQSN